MSVIATIPYRNPDWDAPTPGERAQADAAAAIHARDDRDDAWVADLNGDPPHSISDTLLLSPRRALLARYIRWRQTIAAELATLQAKRDEFQEIMAAPEETEVAIRSAVKRTADWLLGRSTDNSDEGTRKALDDQLAAQRHRAEAARAALVELEPQIERAQLRVQTLNDRQNEFLKPVLREIADELGLGTAYIAKIAELKRIASLIYGLAEASYEFGEGIETGRKVQFPRPATSEAALPGESFIIPSAGNVEIWRKVADQLLLDPRYDITKLLQQ